MSSRGKQILSLALEKVNEVRLKSMDKKIEYDENPNLKTPALDTSILGYQPSCSKIPVDTSSTQKNNKSTDYPTNQEFDEYLFNDLPGLFSSDGSSEYIPNWDDISSSSDPVSDPSCNISNNIDVTSNPVLNQIISENLNDESSKIPELNLSNEVNIEARQVIQEIRKKRKHFQPRESDSKKRKSNPDTWKKRSAALARERGKAYLSYKNQYVVEKKPIEGILCRVKCRLQCSSLFDRVDRLKFLEEFYKLDVNAKNALLFKSIEKKPVARERKGSSKHKSASYLYTVTQNGVTKQVCKEALCAIYQIGRKKVDIIKSRIQSGMSAPPPDLRGKHSNRPHKMDSSVMQSIIDHINQFPVEEAHYSRNRNPHKKYLSPLLNVTKMYQLYLEKCDQNKLPEKLKITKSSYTKIFVSKFNLSFGRPRSDTCSTCDAGDATLNTKKISMQRLKH